jgi:hypothetical protein
MSAPVPPDQGPLFGRLVLTLGVAMGLGCIVLIILLWLGS